MALTAVPCPPDCPALARAESWLPCQPRLPERPPWELQRLMLETGRLDLTGVGECMFPAVKPGDRLIPLEQPAADFQVGQVAVIRRSGVLFGHRVIEVGSDEHGAYIITQGDNNAGNDGRSYDGDVLGVVRAVFRGGRQLAEEELAPRAPGAELWLRQPRQALRGTALAVLRGAEIGDIVVVVTRYFGGTKLGTGGLVRAYGGAAKEVLAALPLELKVEKALVGMTVEYTYYERLKLTLEAHQAEIAHEDFAADVTVFARLPADQVPSLSDALQNLTAGQSELVVLEESDAP